MNRRPRAMGRRWLRRSDYSRRDTRQSAKRRGSAPIGGGRESPLTHPAPRCRHDSSRTRGSSQPPPAAAALSADAPFFAASNRSERPSIAVASTAIGLAERTYIDLENALVQQHINLRVAPEEAYLKAVDKVGFEAALKRAGIDTKFVTAASAAA